MQTSRTPLQLFRVQTEDKRMWLLETMFCLSCIRITNHSYTVYTPYTIKMHYEVRHKMKVGVRSYAD